MKWILIFFTICIFFIQCNKSTTVLPAILSVQVLQDTLPIAGATVVFATVEPTGYLNDVLVTLTNEQGIAKLTNPQKQAYSISASKDCSISAYRSTVDMSKIKVSTTVIDTAYIFPVGTVKVINNTSDYYRIDNVLSWTTVQDINPGDTIIRNYYQSKDPSFYIQKESGSFPHPTQSYNLIVKCGDTSIITLP